MGFEPYRCKPTVLARELECKEGSLVLKLLGEKYVRHIKG